MIDFEHAEKLADEELVNLTLENQENFLFIINRYKLKLFNYINRITNISDEDIEDLLQEVFIKVYLNLNDFNPEFKFSSWIYSITHNQVISNFRKLQSRAEGHSSAIGEDIIRTIAFDFDIKNDIDREFLKQNIFKVFDKLDTKYREVLVLRFFEEKNYQEISDIIKRPIGTTGSLINKAKEEFKKELHKQNIKLTI